MIRRALVCLGLSLTVTATARAEPVAPLPPVEKQSLEAFAAANSACREWSDGCVVCTRQAGTGYACSTPGIACQSSPLACRDPAPAPAAPKNKP